MIVVASEPESAKVSLAVPIGLPSISETKPISSKSAVNTCLVLFVL